MPDADRDILRRLAGEVAEIAALDVHDRKRDMWRRLNRLEPVRPMVWINEVCWDEMGPDVVPRAEDPVLREVEGRMRRLLFQWRHFPCDMVVDGWIACPVAVGSTGFGLARDVHRTDADLAKSAVDYVPTLTDEADVEKIRTPEVTVDRDATERRFALMDETFGDILPPRRVGVTNTWFGAWDQLVQWIGIQELYTAMIDRPGFIRAAIERMVEAMLGQYEQYERLGVLSLNNGAVRVGAGGLGITDELPQADFDGEHVRLIDMWGNSAPQIFSEVSPEMHWEFALKYEMRALERFGLNCYGCCEPYHRKVHILRRIPRLRRISMSPFVDVAAGAEAVGQDYIYSAKPNPAPLAANAWDASPAGPAATNLREILDRTGGLHVELILKDIHTVRNEPRRLFDWARMAMAMAQESA